MKVNFEDIGKKISEGSKSAVKKTKTVTETMKIKNKLAEEEDTLETLYVELGERYFKLFSDKPGDEFTKLCAAIKNSKHKIEELSKELNGLKGIKTCKECGSEIGDNEIYCKKCGAKIK